MTGLNAVLRVRPVGVMTGIVTAAISPIKEGIVIDTRRTSLGLLVTGLLLCRTGAEVRGDCPVGTSCTAGLLEKATTRASSCRLKRSTRSEGGGKRAEVA